MRTRSSGPAKDLCTGQILLDTSQSFIPAFTHPPVSFNPYPEAAFPTIEFPVPQRLGQKRQSDAVRNENDSQAMPDRSDSSNILTPSQLRAQDGSHHQPETIYGVEHQQEKSRSADNEMAILQGKPTHRWVSYQQPGEFQCDPYWIDDNKLRDKNEDAQNPPVEPKSYEVIPTWSSLSPGVQIVVMAEMVAAFGLEFAPRILELTPEEINKYVDLQESESRGQAAELAKTAEYNNYGFQQLLARKLDGADSMELLNLQLSNGSIWEAATFAMTKPDLKAGSRFLLSHGFDDLSENLWMYHGVDADDGYDFGHLSSRTTGKFQNISSSKEQSSLDMIDNETGDQAKNPEVHEFEANTIHQRMPTSQRNLLLDNVKRPTTVKPPRRQIPTDSKPIRLTPSKLRLSITINEIEPGQLFGEPDADGAKARVARQVPIGTDLSKAVKYTKPIRQWAQVANARRGSKEHHMQKQQLKVTPPVQRNYTDLTESQPGMLVNMRNQNSWHNMHHQKSEISFEPPRIKTKWLGRKLVVCETMINQNLSGHSEVPVVRNIAEFASPDLAATWAKKPTITAHTKSYMESFASIPATIDSTSNRLNSLSDKAPPVRMPPETPVTNTRLERKRAPTNEFLTPFDASTPGHVNKTQKVKTGMLRSKYNRPNEQEQCVENREIPIETLKAGERPRTTKPWMARKNTEGTSKQEWQCNKQEDRRKGGQNSFLIPRRLLYDPEDEDV